MDREVLFGGSINVDDIVTASDYGLILNSFDIQPPEPKLHTVELPAADGVIDLSCALTDGEVRYNNRELNMRFISMHKTHAERMAVAEDIVHGIHGKKMYIQLPDDTYKYYGRCTVGIEKYPGYTIINITADCEPYRYNTSETVQTFKGAEVTERTLTENIAVKGLKLYASAAAPMNIYTRARAIGGMVLPGYIDFTNTSVLSNDYRVIELTPEADTLLTVYYANNSPSSAHTIAIMQNGEDIAEQSVPANESNVLTINLKAGTKARIYAKNGGIRIYGINLGTLSWRSTDFLEYESTSYNVNVSNSLHHNPMIPELVVNTGTVSVYGNNVSLTRIPKGTHKLYDFTVKSGESQSFEIKLDTGASAEIHSRERKL